MPTGKNERHGDTAYALALALSVRVRPCRNYIPYMVFSYYISSTYIALRFTLVYFSDLLSILQFLQVTPLISKFDNVFDSLSQSLKQGHHRIILEVTGNAIIEGSHQFLTSPYGSRPGGLLGNLRLRASTSL